MAQRTPHHTHFVDPVIVGILVNVPFVSCAETLGDKRDISWEIKGLLVVNGIFEGYVTIFELAI